MKRTLITLALLLALSTFTALAQDKGAPPPPENGPADGQKHGPGGFHLLPPHAAEKLKLTAGQQQQLADLEAQVKAQLEKILTPEQLQQLKQMHPPHPPGGQGAPGGPGGNQSGDTDGANSQSNQPPPPGL